ncbi:MAG: hypothetical protein V8S72_01235 [Oscillospiraceae bacterium]
MAASAISVAAANAVNEGRGLGLFGSDSAAVDEIPRVRVEPGPGWAYLRIAKGCDDFCAFCAIPYIRGRYRSRPSENIIDKTTELAQHGVEELIVIAQDITRYGTDIYGKRSLARLCRELPPPKNIEWSLGCTTCTPTSLTTSLSTSWPRMTRSSSPSTSRYSTSDNAILKRMNRRGTGDRIRKLLKTLRE